ncbi:uncharacterized protein TNCV_3310281 [Trichonephila clavipes]|nr:uncharacterized protein TNCV_3310281 [Trichonephila clavipes]
MEVKKHVITDKKYSIHPDNHSLKIHDLTRNDAGEYKCKAFVFTHLSSQIKDFDIKLHVQYVPEIIGEQRISTYASVGSKKNLTCTVTGDPIPIFQWLHDEMIIHNNTKNFVIYSTENTSVLQAKTDSLIFLQLTISHDGQWRNIPPPPHFIAGDPKLG